MERLIIVSGDGHIGPPVEQYREYLDPEYRHLMPELIEDEQDLQVINSIVDLQTPERLSVVDPRNRIKSGGYDGGWSTEQRLAELDAEGIAAEVVFPGTNFAMTPFFYQFNRPYPDDVRWAGVRAYHRWTADFIAPAKGRLIGTIEPGPSLDMDEAIAEMRFCADRGFRGVYVPGTVRHPKLPPLTDKHYEPFWAACNDMNLVVTVHVGWGIDQGPFTALCAEVKKVVAMGHEGMGFQDGWEKVMGMLDEENPLSMFALGLGPRQIIWQMIFSGVFDRYPNLKLQVAECRADWVPELKSYLNRRFLGAPKRPSIKMKPSEYFGKNIFITPSSPRRLEVALRHEIGVDNWMFGADFPHPESTWPNTLSWLRAAFYDVPEPDLRAMLGETAIKVYGLDRDMLSKVAARIGHLPSDIVGDYKIDERLIADFDMRSNFTKETPPFNQQDLDNRVNADLAATAA